MRLLGIALLLLALPPAARAQASGATGATGDTLLIVPPGGLEIPSLFGREHVFLRATVGGVPTLLLFDSGASATVLTPGLVSRLGLARRGRQSAFGVGAPVGGVRQHDAPEIALGDLRFRPRQVLTWEGVEPPSYRGVPAEGILGADLLQQAIVQVDWRAGRVLLRARDDAPPGLAWSPLRVVGGLPVVDGALFAGGTPLAVATVLDFGAGTAMQVSARALDRVPAGWRMRDPRPRELTGIGGTVPMVEWRVDSVGLGGAVVPGALVSVDTSSILAVALAEAEGLVGTQLLRRFVVTLDYAGGRVALQPTPHARGPMCRNAAGVCLVLRSRGDVALVEHVERESPAWRAGVRPGQELVSIDGTPIATLGLEGADRALDQIYVPHALEVVRPAGMIGEEPPPVGAPRRIDPRQPRLPVPPPRSRPTTQTITVLPLPAGY